MSLVFPVSKNHSSLDTHLFMIPKSHPCSDNPWTEWRISFSLIEKVIYINIPYLFRKVYLICKTLTSEWKKKFKFHSYVLKTVFLWKYEEWGEKDVTFSEDLLINMIIDVFSCLLKWYENKNVPMYFMPEMNLLEQYSKTKQEKLLHYLRKDHKHGQPKDDRGLPKQQISKDKLESVLISKSEISFFETLKRYTEKSSMMNIVIGSFQYPFHPIVGKVCLSGNSGIRKYEIMPRYHSKSDKYRIQNQPSHRSIHAFYDKKVLKNKGILNEEEEQDLLCEVYITFLFLLHERIFNASGYDFQIKNNCIAHTLYFLKVFGRKYIVDKHLPIDFIVRYCESIDVLCADTISFGFLQAAIDIKKEPYLTFLQDTFRECSGNFLDELSVDRANLAEETINGNLDEELFSYLSQDQTYSHRTFSSKYRRRKVTAKKNIYQYGDKKRSENAQKNIEKMIFWQEDQIFSAVVDAINKYFRKTFYSRYALEAKMEKEASENLSKRSYLHQHLLHHMCEMYNYGFTLQKFELPTPAVYISFLLQLLVNIEEFHNESKLIANTVKRIPDKWGYTLKEADGYIYRTYDERVHNTFLCSLGFIDH